MQRMGMTWLTSRSVQCLLQWEQTLLCRSKSLGNFVTIRDLLKQYHAMALRWFLVNTQYRQPLNFTEGALQDASTRMYYISRTLHETQEFVQEAGGF